MVLAWPPGCLTRARLPALISGQAFRAPEQGESPRFHHLIFGDMSILQLARSSFSRPPAWLRAVFVSLLLTFAVDSVAHVVHTHDDTVKTLGAHAPACGYCAAFDGLIDAPKQSYSPLAPLISAGYVAPACPIPVSSHASLAAQPRAPPR